MGKVSGNFTQKRVRNRTSYRKVKKYCMIVEKNRKERVGQTFISSVGQVVKITEYINCNNCTVEFEDGIVLTNQIYKHIKIGRVVNPYYKSLLGIGYLGEGLYNSFKHSCFYHRWSNLIKRCYDKNALVKHPSYKDVTVCEEWKCFQNFAEWCEQNYLENWHLDKDILFKGNKLYSPETCCFVPIQINNIFIKRKNGRGEYPIGVSKYRNKFVSQLSLGRDKQKHIGVFNTPEEAFQSYKTAKEAYIKEVADEWKSLIKLNVYEAMYNYKVEITD